MPVKYEAGDWKVSGYMLMLNIRIANPVYREEIGPKHLPPGTVQSTHKLTALLSAG
jgi:hypothetical protein